MLTPVLVGTIRHDSGGFGMKLGNNLCNKLTTRNFVVVGGGAKLLRANSL